MEKKLIKIYISTIEERYLPFSKVVKKYSLKQFKEDKKVAKNFLKLIFYAKLETGILILKDLIHSHKFIIKPNYM